MGHFMCQDIGRVFSNIPRDQMYEQQIDVLKIHTGIIENLDGPSIDRSEQVICLELARLFREFKGTDWLDNGHEQYPRFQSDYKSAVITLMDAFEQIGK